MGGGQGYSRTPYNTQASVIQPSMSVVARVRNAAVERREERKGKELIFQLQSQFNCGALWARVRNEGAGARGGDGAQEDAGILPIVGLPESGIS